MKKGISIWSFAKNSLPEVFELAKKAGFDGVELSHDEVGPVSLESTEADLLKVKQQAADAGIELYSVATGLYWTYSLTSPDAAQRAKAESIVKKQLENAKVLGCDTILVVPGAVRVGFAPELGVNDYETVYKRSLEAFQRLKEDAEKTGVSIGIENVWNCFLLSPMEMKDFIDKIGSPAVGSYFDVGNVLAYGEPEHWIHSLGDRIKKVHFKDFQISTNSFVDLMEGDVNYPGVMKAFADIGYDGWVTAEMMPPYKYYPDMLIHQTSAAMDAILGRR